MEEIKFELICPDCKGSIKRQYGLPGIVYICPKCGKELVKCLDRLVPKDEFHSIRESWQ